MIDTWQAASKTILSELKAMVFDPPANLKSDNPTLADRVFELQKQDK